MKALSVKNPWAFFIALGIKDVENRTWRTNYRGRIYIHVPRSADSCFVLTGEQRKLFSLHTLAMVQWFVESNVYSQCIIGEAKIIDCVNNSKSSWAEPGRWHWLLDNALIYEKEKVIKNVKGKLSLWEYERG